MRSFFSQGLPPLLRTALVLAASLCLACSQRSPEEDLVDQAGTPFLVAGDAPQCLTVKGSIDDATFLFQTRAAQGYNATWVNLLCDSYTGGFRCQCLDTSSSGDE